MRKQINLLICKHFSVLIFTYFKQVHQAELLHSVEQRLPALVAENVTDNPDIIDLKIEQEKQDQEFGKECPV